jgi:site-specific recombinase XerD
MCGIKFFYEYTIKRDWPTLTLARAPRQSKLPPVLGQHEVQRVLSQIRIFRHRACLTTIYFCGLCIKEGTHLQIGDIHSDRMLVHVRFGKGGKACPEPSRRNRYVPLPHKTLFMLREFYKTHRNPLWLFPAPGRSGTHMSTSTEPLPRSSVQIVFKTALRECGIKKQASVHTLRHSYATHLLRKGRQPSLDSEIPRPSLTTHNSYLHSFDASSAGYKVIEEIMDDLSV